MSNSLYRKAKRNQQRHKGLVKAVEKMQLPIGKVPVSVTMIVKDCAETLQRTLESLKQTFLLPNDEIVIVDTGSQDGGATAKVARDYGARLIDRSDLRVNLRPYVEKWLPELMGVFEKTPLVTGSLLDFAQARNVAMREAKNDIQFWIDSDDVLREGRPFSLRSAIEQVFGETPRKLDAIFMDYEYWTDPSDGAITSLLKRERVIDRRVHYWLGRCHETAIQRPGMGSRAAMFQNLPSAIRHIRDVPDGRNISSADIRNYIIIRNEIEQDKAAGRRVDPRSTFYLGNAARGVRHPAEAIQLYQDFLPLSGSMEDRFAAAYYIATIYLDEQIGRPQDALEYCWKCLQLKPDDPRGYYALQRAYFHLKLYDVANSWYEVGRRFPEPTQSLHNYDPRHIHVLPHQVRALSAIRQKNKPDLMTAMDRLVQASPDHEETKNLSDFASNWLAGVELTDSVKRLVANSHATGEKAIEVGREITKHLTDMPEEIEDAFLAHKEPRIEVVPGLKPLDIMCGKAIEAWGPRSGENGIGGSEKAVIQMAPRLAARGFQVNVYANIPKAQRGVDRNTRVNWQHYGGYDFERERDTVIYWRSPLMLHNKMGYRRRIVWCHDVQLPDQWTDERIALADQVWVLTQFHKSTLGAAAEKLGDKVKITRNGIDSRFLRSVMDEVKAQGLKRNPKRVIYASSPDRGVLTAMKMFVEARKQDPKLEMRVFYGFNKLFIENAAKCQYGAIPDLGRDGNMFEYWSEALRFADANDIPWRGRVGWAELAAEMAQAGIWLYPTRFPEISCMASMESMALGCIPVHSGRYALAETVGNRGFIVDPDNVRGAANILVHAAGMSEVHPIRQQLSEFALTEYDYEKLADDWVELLKE